MRVRTILAGPVMLLLVTGCFRSETQKQAEELAQAGKQMAEAMAGAGVVRLKKAPSTFPFLMASMPSFR